MLRAYSRRLRSANGRPASQRWKRSGTSAGLIRSLIGGDPICRRGGSRIATGLQLGLSPQLPGAWRLREVSRHRRGLALEPPSWQACRGVLVRLDPLLFRIVVDPFVAGALREG